MVQFGSASWFSKLSLKFQKSSDDLSEWVLFLLPKRKNSYLHLDGSSKSRNEQAPCAVLCVSRLFLFLSFCNRWLFQWSHTVSLCKHECNAYMFTPGEECRLLDMGSLSSLERENSISLLSHLNLSEGGDLDSFCFLVVVNIPFADQTSFRRYCASRWRSFCCVFIQIWAVPKFLDLQSRVWYE